MNIMNHDHVTNYGSQMGQPGLIKDRNGYLHINNQQRRYFLMNINTRKFNMLSDMIDLPIGNKQIDTNWNIRAIIGSGVLSFISAKLPTDDFTSTFATKNQKKSRIKQSYLKKFSPRSLKTEGETIDQHPGLNLSFNDPGTTSPDLGRNKNLFA